MAGWAPGQRRRWWCNGAPRRWSIAERGMRPSLYALARALFDRGYLDPAEIDAVLTTAPLHAGKPAETYIEPGLLPRRPADPIVTEATIEVLNNPPDAAPRGRP